MIVKVMLQTKDGNHRQSRVLSNSLLQLGIKLHRE
jgi:hypothetical protein